MTRPLQKGDFVLTDMLRYSDSWPQLGQVIMEPEVQGHDVTISWYNGSLNGQWKEHLLRKKGVKGLVQWTETIKRSVIWMYGFNLTPRGFIPKHIKDSIEKYEQD